jgi:hypothetical protein
VSFILPTTNAPICDGEYFCPRASIQASPFVCATILKGTLLMSCWTAESLNFRPINLDIAHERWKGAWFIACELTAWRQRSYSHGSQLLVVSQVARQDDHPLMVVRASSKIEGSTDLS